MLRHQSSPGGSEGAALVPISESLAVQKHSAVRTALHGFRRRGPKSNSELERDKFFRTLVPAEVGIILPAEPPVFRGPDWNVCCDSFRTAFARGPWNPALPPPELLIVRKRKKYKLQTVNIILRVFSFLRDQRAGRGKLFGHALDKKILSAYTWFPRAVARGDPPGPRRVARRRAQASLPSSLYRLQSSNSKAPVRVQE